MGEETALSFSKLQSLLDFAEAGSITATANRKGRDSSSISRELSDLEHYFGCKLRENTGKTARLSSEGAELVRIVREQQATLNAFKERQSENLSSVSVAGGDSLLHLLLLPGISALQKQFRQTVIDVSSMGTFDLIQGLLNYSIDLGLLTEDAIKPKREALSEGGVSLSARKSLDWEGLQNYGFLGFVSRELWTSSSLRGTDLVKLPMASIRNHWDINFVQLAEDEGFSENVRVWCDNFTLVLRLVILRKHAGILPHFCKDILPESRYRSCELDFLKDESHKIVLAWNRNLANIRGARFNAFVEALKGQLSLRPRS